MKLISCNTMRDGVIVSLAFLIIGSVLLVLVSRVLPQIAYVSITINLVGIIMVLFAPFILTTTFIATVWPGSKEKLDNCDH